MSDQFTVSKTKPINIQDAKEKIDTIDGIIAKLVERKKYLNKYIVKMVDHKDVE